MIGDLTTMILEHWCETEHEIPDKHALILMSFKCKSMDHYDDFHREWMQHIYEVADIKNILWKKVYLVALPNKHFDYFKVQGIFKQPYKNYTCEEIYSIITSALVGLCTNTNVNKSIQNISRHQDSKSICEKYGLSIDTL